MSLPDALRLRWTNATSSAGSKSHLLRRLAIDGYGPDGEPNWQESLEVDQFFQALVEEDFESIQLENLGMFAYQEGNSWAFPVSLLTRLLRSALQKESSSSNLERLELRDIVLQGTNQEWDELINAASRLSSLKVFVMETASCWVNYPGLRFVNFEMLLHQVSGNSNLTELTVIPQAFDNSVNLTAFTMDRLCRTPSLKKLTISALGTISNDLIGTMLETLSIISESTRLEFLDLSPCQILNASAGRALCRFLLGPNTTLKRIRLKPKDECGETRNDDEAAIHDDGENLIIQLLNSLKRNRTIQHIYLPITPVIMNPTSPVLDAYKEVMECNCELLDMNLFSHSLWRHVPAESRIFYAKLNRHGRKRFLQESQLVSKEDWVELLATTNDLSCKFYFLRLHPMLCFQG